MGGVRLSDETLGRLGRRVAVPHYARRHLVPSVVHLSVGSFHRSHQAMYFEELAGRGHTGWGLTGVGLRRRAMGEALSPQDGLYTVVERGAQGDRARVVGVMARYLFAPDEPRRVAAALADPRTRLVTLTVTGAAYHVDPASGAFAADAEELTADLAAEAPRSAIGVLVDGLAARRLRGRAPFTVLSCDNMASNGEVTRQAVVSYARLRDERLADWIAERVAFPSSMVDRITPRTTDADRARLAQEFGVIDRWPVMTERFSDWVIEDAFCNARPPLEEVGVRFVADVRPWSLVKTRMLNASHLALGALGRLAGLRTISDVLRDPVFRAYADALLGVEVAPSLASSGMDLDAYRRSVLERLANPKMRDGVARLCRDASTKMGRHLVPSVVAARAAGRPHPLLTLAVAGVCLQLRGADDRGRRFAVDDPAAGRPGAPAAERTLLGALAGDERFMTDFRRAVAALQRDGVRVTVAATVATDQLLAA